MGKKNKQGGSSQLGRSLIKDRFGSTKGKKMVSDNSMVRKYDYLWILVVNLIMFSSILLKLKMVMIGDGWIYNL